MSIHTALQFIQHVHGNEALKRQLQALGSKATLESLAAIGATAGFSFTAEELQKAFKHDWGMRRAHYQARGGESDGAGEHL